MASFQKFEQIDAWQKTRELTKEVYAVTQEGPFNKDVGLREQIRRAGVSSMSNIAEGFERDGKGELMQFLSMAKGSVGEVRSQLYVAFDQGYIDKKTFDRLSLLATECSRLISGLMKYLAKSEFKGTKYKKPEP
jgi:four helix bundle protein